MGNLGLAICTTTALGFFLLPYLVQSVQALAFVALILGATAG